MAKPNGALAYFHEHLHDETDQCMIWPFGLDSDGYASLHIDGRTRRAMVVACIAHHGPRPTASHEVAHGPCHDRRCWNGRHLSWRTRAENVHDKHRDGTMRTKVTESDVRAMRSAYARGDVSLRALASTYGINFGTVGMIVRGERWRHVV